LCSKIDIFNFSSGEKFDLGKVEPGEILAALSFKLENEKMTETDRIVANALIKQLKRRILC